MQFLLRLLDVVLPPRTTRALVASATIESLGALVSPTTHRLATITITSLLPYRAPLVRALIHEAKYHGDKKAIELLGTVLADYLRTYEEDRQFDTNSIVLLPVPLASKRLQERGYNQVERVACAALRGLSDRYRLDTKLITRTRETEPQARLPRKKRLTNMHGAFALTGTLPTGAALILLDDVATTGSTLAAMEAVLPNHAGTTILLALAH